MLQMKSKTVLTRFLVCFNDISSKTRKKLVSKNEKIKHYLPLFVAIVVSMILMAAYLILYSNSRLDISTVIETVLLIVAGVAFWLEFYHKNRVEEAKFIIDLNNQFITDPNMTQVEHVLEQYYYAVKEVKTKAEIREFEEKIRDMFSIDNPERQSLVNYLVHLEGIATLVNTGVLRLKAINDLMAYRYFIAVNNPIVQELELFPYKEYYNGCFDIYRGWKKYIKDMPLIETPLIPEK